MIHYEIAAKMYNLYTTLKIIQYKNALTIQHFMSKMGLKHIKFVLKKAISHNSKCQRKGYGKPI